MSLSSIRDRHKKRSFLSSRTLALALIVTIGGLCFALGYYAGSKGEPRVSDATRIVPEGAGLVLLGSNDACQESTSPGITIETLTAKSIPTPDIKTAPRTPAENIPMAPDEPVIEKIAAPESAKTTTKPMQATPTAEKTEPQIEAKKAPVTQSKPAPIQKKPVPKKPVPKKVVVTESPDSRAYSVQIGAFRSLADAQTHKRRFTKKGYKASVYKDDSAIGNARYKVRIGVYNSRKEAAKAANQLAQEGVSGFVTPLY